MLIIILFSCNSVNVSQSRRCGERVKRDLTSHVMILWNDITSTHVMRVRFKDESWVRYFIRF